MLGTAVSHYRILGVLGGGGMGDVYAAVDETLGRRVALKAIRSERRLSPSARARFVREARILSQLDHQHICRVYDYVTRDEADFIVLELVDGRSLRHAINEGIASSEALRIAQEITSALVLAHSHGIVHRDLKPENVMLTVAGAVKVLDFGLASSDSSARGDRTDVERELAALRGTVQTPDAETVAALAPAPGDTTLPLSVGAPLTMAGQVMGTLSYMSPEQARGEPVTPASDMYALGLMLQELFTGSAAYPPQLEWPALAERVTRGATLPAKTRDPHLTALIEQLKSPNDAERPTSKETLDRLHWIHGKPRRMRLRAAAVAALAIVALAAFKYTVDLRYERSVAVAAREDADRRREQAEELIGFMLGDLRGRLEPLGRLDVLDEVGSRATRYFAAVPESAHTPEELYRRSQALRQIGEVRTAQGNLEAAQDAFAQSLGLARDLAERDPDNGVWQVGLAASHFWLGSVAYYRSDFAAARASFERYLEISRRLVEREPANAEYQQELAYAYSNLGSVDESVGKLDAALHSFRQVLAISEQLARLDSSSTARILDVALAHNKIGVVTEKRGDLAAAIEEYRIDRELRAGLAERDTANTSWRNHAAISHLYLGNALRAIGRLPEGRSELERASRLTEALVRQDPDNTDWQRGAAVARRQLAWVLTAQNQIPAALSLLDDAITTLGALVARDQTNSDWRRQFALACWGRARALLAAHRPVEASRDAARATALLQSLLDKSPEDRRSRTDLADAHITDGQIRAQMGDLAGAQRAFQRAADLVEPLVTASFGADAAAPYARALIHLKQTARAQTVVEDLVRRGYRDRELLLASRDAGLRITR
jgi:eukaryotic-like serine/threonine-protein kinase